jgi:hypothetical protein
MPSALLLNFDRVTDEAEQPFFSRKSVSSLGRAKQSRFCFGYIQYGSMLVFLRVSARTEQDSLHSLWYAGCLAKVLPLFWPEFSHNCDTMFP